MPLFWKKTELKGISLIFIGEAKASNFNKASDLESKCELENLQNDIQ